MISQRLIGGLLLLKNTALRQHKMLEVLLWLLICDCRST